MFHLAETYYKRSADDAGLKEFAIKISHDLMTNGYAVYVSARVKDKIVNKLLRVDTIINPDVEREIKKLSE